MPTDKKSVTFYVDKDLERYLKELEIRYGADVSSRSALINIVVRMYCLMDRLGVLDEALRKVALTQGCQTVADLRKNLSTNNEKTKTLSEGMQE